MKSNSLILSRLAQTLSAFLAGSSTASSTPPLLLVAYSGGVDSVVLLHALAQLRPQLTFTLAAMHVHHGLSPHADNWLQACEQQCLALNVVCYSERVQLDLASGAGIEATAREARYQALTRMADQIGASAIVTAHHLQDQGETLLLQLMRGAGVKGLSAMGAWDAERHLLRPLLDIPKQDLLDYAAQADLQWVDDESNADTRFDRNFMRHTVMPVMRERYPQLDQALARSAGHMADAQQLLDTLAAQDLVTCEVRDEWLGQSIALKSLHGLGDVRAKNLLRYWFQLQQLRMPNTEQLQDYWQQLSAVKPNRYLHLPLQGQADAHRAYLHHYQQRLYSVAKPPSLPSTPLVWNGENSQQWGGWQVEFRVCKGRGIALARLGVSPAAITLNRRYGLAMGLGEGITLCLQPRAGGEVLQPDSKRPRRELKVLFQMLGIPPWQRAFYPVVYVNTTQPSDSQTLVALSSLAIDAGWQPGRNAYGLEITLSPLR